MESKYALQAHDLIAGTVGGCLGIFVGTPFDFVKVRLQSPNYNYKGPVDAVRSILRNEGFSSFFKGLVPPLISNVPINAIGFATYANCYRSFTGYVPPPPLAVPQPETAVKLELLKQLQRDISPSITANYVERHSKYTTSAENVSLTAKFLAGCVSGWLQCFIATPSEFLKIQEQNVEGVLNKGSLGIAKDLIKQYGVRSLFRGYLATNIRDVPAVGVYFLVYEYVKWTLRSDTFTVNVTTTPSTVDSHSPQLPGVSPSPQQPNARSMHEPPPYLSVNWHHQHEFSIASLLIAGGFAGIATWLSTYPMDVIKTHIQSLPHEQLKEHGSIMNASRFIINQKGWRFLFTGLSTTIVRAIPVNAVTFLAYEKTVQSCRQNRFLMPKQGHGNGGHNI